MNEDQLVSLIKSLEQRIDETQSMARSQVTSDPIVAQLLAILEQQVEGGY